MQTTSSKKLSVKENSMSPSWAAWHRRNTTTMCALWVITVMADEWFRNVWAFVPLKLWLLPAPYWIIAVDPMFPALSGWWVTLRLRRWVRCESQKMTCPCESHDALLPVPWNYNSVTGRCANVCLMKPQNSWPGWWLKMRMLSGHVSTPTPSFDAALLTKSRSLQTVNHMW